MALLKRSDDGGAPRNNSEVNAILGRGAEFDGKLSFEGTVRIDGVFKGKIVSDAQLIVGETARVEGEIDIGVLVVYGEIKGTIRAKQFVEMHAPARVSGAVETPALAIEKGVVFEGSTKMLNLGGQKSVPAGSKADPSTPGWTSN
ncbi:MAG: hypothetical protein GMKNLPBB_02750 [Myxococcota bacterium]|nr:hypothetical protein [Myxococcota bacterium]